MVLPSEVSQTRQQILRAALRRFAHCGYAATSVMQIVSDAKVSKPTLYYYFADKAGLFQALVNEAHDERYRLLQEAAAQAEGVRAQLVEILVVLFDYFRDNRELMRISLATAFASPGEVPDGFSCNDRCERNFEFVHDLIKRGQASGEVGDRFDSCELAFGFYGQDDWKIKPRLTLTFGLRWEMNLALSEQDNLAANFFPDRGLVTVGQGINSLYNNDPWDWGPRLGFAWDVFGTDFLEIHFGCGN